MHGCAWDVILVDGHWETHDYNPLIWPHSPEDGTLLTFGQNDKGQLGHSSNDDMVPVSQFGACFVTAMAHVELFPVPTPVPAGSGTARSCESRLSRGAAHSLCLK